MHRDMAWYVFDPAEELGPHLPPPGAFDWVLLDFHEPSLSHTGEFGREVLRQYQSDPNFVQLRGGNGLYLFQRRKITQ
jgi:hypothetical protein